MTRRRVEADRLFYVAAGAVPAHAVPTLRALLAYRRAGMGAWPSQRYLAARLDLSERTVRRHVAALIAAGVLDVETHRAHHHPTTGQWRRRTNRYRCRFPPKRPGQTHRGSAPSPRGHARPHDVPMAIPSTRPAPPDGSGVGAGSGDPCACGQPTPPGKWRCPDCQARVEAKPTPAAQLAAKLRDRPV